MGNLPACVGIILAGGKSRRFGRPKAWAALGKTSFVEHLYLLLSGIFDETYVVQHRDTEEFAGMSTLQDIYPEGGPLNGIYSALVITQAPAVFVSACDLPNLNRRDIEFLLQRWSPELPALVYRRRGRWEPLCGIYHSDLVPALCRRLEEKKYRLQDFLKEVGARGLEYPRGGENTGLMNINTPEDYRRLRSATQI